MHASTAENSKMPSSLKLTREAATKLRTLAECLNFENESAVVNELFYQFVLNQDPDRRRMIMTAYQMNVKDSATIIVAPPNANNI